MTDREWERVKLVAQMAATVYAPDCDDAVGVAISTAREILAGAERAVAAEGRDVQPDDVPVRVKCGARSPEGGYHCTHHTKTHHVSNVFEGAYLHGADVRRWPREPEAPKVVQPDAKVWRVDEEVDLTGKSFWVQRGAGDRCSKCDRGMDYDDSLGPFDSLEIAERVCAVLNGKPVFRPEFSAGEWIGPMTAQEAADAVRHFAQKPLALPKRPEGFPEGPYVVVRTFEDLARPYRIAGERDETVCGCPTHDAAAYLTSLLNAANGYAEGSAE